MAWALAPIPGFPYDVEPPKSGWTKTYVKDAIHSPNDPRLVEDLFNQAAQLVATHNLTNDNYRNVQNSVTVKARDRAAAGQQLLTQLGGRLTLQHNPDFPARLCRGVITYMSGSAERIPAASANPTPSSSQSQPAFTPPIPSPQPSILITHQLDRSTTPFFRAQSTLTPRLSSADNSNTPRPFADFILHCSSYRLSKDTPSLRMRVRQIWPDLPPDNVQLLDVTLAPLIKKLKDRCLITDDASQFLTYQADGNVASIVADEDLQNALWEATSMNETYLRIQVTSAEDYGSAYPVIGDQSREDTLPRMIDFREGSQMQLSIRSASKKTCTHGEPGSRGHSSSIDETLSIDQPPPNKRRKKCANASQQSYRDENLFEQIQSAARDIELLTGDRQTRETSTDDVTSSELLEDMTDFDVPDEILPRGEDDAASDDNGQYDERFRQTMDGQVCEHRDDGFWNRAADLVGLDREDSHNTSMWQMPGMLEPLLHWQWLAVFVCASMNSGANGLHGALLADEMGLGKTAEALGLAVFRLQLFRRWQAIKKEWAHPPPKPTHCAEDAPEDSLCPSRETPHKWWAACPCEPLSPLHENCPIEGPTLFIVPASNLDTWDWHVRRFVDLQKLRIRYALHHGKHTIPNGMRDDLRTTVVSLPSTKAKQMESGVHFGRPQPNSCFIWVLTTYQTWNTFSKTIYGKTRTYNRTVSKVKTEIPQNYVEFHAALWVVDECHFVKNIGKGPWRLAEIMKSQQPNLRPWTLAMSGTMLTADPTDIIGPVSVISSDTWNTLGHPLHHLRPDGLSAARKLMDKHYRVATEKSKKDVDDALSLFRHGVANILMRRHDGSRWNGKRLIDLPLLHSKVVSCPFPEEYSVQYDGMMKTWSTQNLKLLKAKQAKWDLNQHDPQFLKEYPERPTHLRAEKVFHLARLLRVCANLPYLTVLAPTIDNKTMRWTNEDVIRICENTTTGRMKDGCSLDKYFAQIVENCPKLRLIVKILAHPRHKGAAVLIMSSFPEFLLVVERYLRQTAGRRTCMYTGTVDKRKAAVSAFMLMKDEHGELLDQDQPDTLIGLASTMGTGANLQRATVVFLCEPVYDAKLQAQAPKRAHRQGNPKEVWYYLLTSKTSIEQLVEDKVARKAGFTAEAFEMTTSEWLRQTAAATVQKDSAAIDGSTAATAIEVEDSDDGEKNNNAI